MKKINIIIGLITLMGIAISCSKNDVSTQESPASNRVGLSVKLPKELITTRAVPTAPSGHQLRCILEIFPEGSSNRLMRKELMQSDTDNFEFDVELSPQGVYNAVLWADYVDASATSGALADKYYTTTASNGLRGVVVKTLTANAPSHRDAFMAIENFKKEVGAKSLTTTLTRALTKIVIAEKNKESYELCTNVKATYKVPTQINVLSGLVNEAPSSLKEAVYNAAPQGGSITVNGEECHVLFSDYVLANTNGTLGDIRLEFTSNDLTKELLPALIPAGIPAKRNYNIQAAGTLMLITDTPSKQTKMSISINDAFNHTAEEECTSIVDKTGYYYLKDNTLVHRDAILTSTQKAACLGIVFWIDPTAPTKGKIVSLKENSDSNCDWECAKAWIKSSNLPVGIDWRLPTIEELQQLYCAYIGVPATTWESGLCPLVEISDAKTVFNSYLTNAGGIKLSNSINGRYWSSSEDDTANAWLIYTNDGASIKRPKSYSEKVRAVASF